MKRSVPLAVFAAGCCIAFAAWAGPKAPVDTSIFNHYQTPPPEKPVLHKPIGSYILSHSIYDEIQLTADFQTVGAPIRFKCPSKDGCTVISIQTAQIFTRDPAERFAMCMIVDGNAPVTGCPGGNAVGVVGDFINQAASNSYTVAEGTHHIYSYVYTMNGHLSLYGYHFIYEITTP